MIKAGKTQAAWVFRIDLRQVGIYVGWVLFGLSVLTIVALYVLAFSQPHWRVTMAFVITVTVAAGMGVCAVIVWGFTLSLRAVAGTIDAYQTGVQDAVARLAEAIPSAPVDDLSRARAARRKVHSLN